MAAGTNRWILLFHSDQKSYLFLQNKIHELVLKLSRIPISAQELVLVKGEICANVQELSGQYEKLLSGFVTAFYKGFSQLIDLEHANIANKPMEESSIESFEQGLLHAIHTNNRTNHGLDG